MTTDEPTTPELVSVTVEVPAGSVDLLLRYAEVLRRKAQQEEAARRDPNRVTDLDAWRRKSRDTDPSGEV